MDYSFKVKEFRPTTTASGWQPAIARVANLHESRTPQSSLHKVCEGLFEGSGRPSQTHKHASMHLPLHECPRDA